MNTNDKTTTNTTTNDTATTVRRTLRKYLTIKNASIAVAVVAGVAAAAYVLKNNAVAVSEAVIEAIE